MNCASYVCYMSVPLLACLCFFPGVFLSSRVTGACPVTTDLIIRVGVRVNVQQQQQQQPCVPTRRVRQQQYCTIPNSSTGTKLVSYDSLYLV